MTGIVADRYAILGPLGEGGVANVFLAEDRVAGQRVALKFFPPIRSSTEEFRREASATVPTRHRGLVRLVDAGMHEGAPWLAIEHVDGQDLREQLRVSAVAPGLMLDWIAQVFDAIDALHRVGLVHGDIKPENVIRAGDRLRLVDFGRARLRFLYGGAGAFPGTAPYMHPDLFAGGAPSPATDCFAAWVMAYELVGGRRPFAVADLRGARPMTIPAFLPLADPELSALVGAGLRGELDSARRSWVAIARYRRGRRDPMPAFVAMALPPPALARRARERVTAGQDVVVVGQPDTTRAVLESVHRGLGAGSLWLSADWGSVAEPMSGALALAARAGDSLSGPALDHLRQHLGPLGRVIAALAPAARTWLGDPGPGAAPTSDQTIAALHRFLLGLPRPALVVVDGLDRLDGASRRFLATAAAAREVVVAGSAAPGAPHGLGEELPVPGEVGPSARVPASQEPLVAARVLGLPFGRLLAAVTGVDDDTLFGAALEAEAMGEARFNGEVVVPQPGPQGDDRVARAWFETAAERLDIATHPLLVARFAMAAGNHARLAACIDAAFDAAIRTDAAEALRLALADPRPRTPERQLRALDAAVMARDMDAARRLLDELAAQPGVSEADRAEAEGEYLFRLGRNEEALAHFRQAAAALGRPVLCGWRAQLAGAWRLLGLALDRPVAARPDPRLARVYERLHDLYFAVDHGPMLHVHARWLEAAPSQPRARAMDVVWKTALGRHDAARRAEAQLAGEVPEHQDPVGAAVVLLHRAIADLWRGETLVAYGAATDAAERLARAGDPYQAALASATMSAAGWHLGVPGPMARLCDELSRLVELVGDVRAQGWILAMRAVLAMHAGRDQEAEKWLGQWIGDAAARSDRAEAVARRVRADWLVQHGDWRRALVDVAEIRRLVKVAHLRLDLTAAVVVPATIAAAQARLAGQAGPAPDLRGLRALVAMSPRWDARAEAARGWWQLAEGKRPAATAAFAAARHAALARRHAFDADDIAHQAALALGQDES